MTFLPVEPSTDANGYMLPLGARINGLLAPGITAYSVAMPIDEVIAFCDADTKDTTRQSGEVQ